MIVRRESGAPAGFALIDLLFYMSMLVVVLAVTAAVFNMFLIQSGGLRRNIDDIERALRAGERWRADLHEATGPVRMEAREGTNAMVIPQARGEVVYVFGNAVRRRAAGSDVWEMALGGVKAGRVLAEKREFAAGWRWEVELDTRRKNPRVRPLFTFMAVAGGIDAH